PPPGCPPAPSPRQPASASAPATAMAQTRYACIASPPSPVPARILSGPRSGVLTAASRNLQAVHRGGAGGHGEGFPVAARAYDPGMSQALPPPDDRVYRWRSGAVEFAEARHGLAASGLPGVGE